MSSIPTNQLCKACRKKAQEYHNAYHRDYYWRKRANKLIKEGKLKVGKGREIINKV